MQHSSKCYLFCLDIVFAVWIFRQPQCHVMFPIHASCVVNFSCPLLAGQHGFAFVLRYERLCLEGFRFPPFERGVGHCQGVAEVLHCKGVTRNAVAALSNGFIAPIFTSHYGYPGRYYTVLRNTGVIPAIFGAKIGSVVGNNFLPKQV